MKLLQNLRIHYMAEKKKGKSHKQIVMEMSSDIFDSGMMYYNANELACRGV
jgi:hypothetical protein